MNTETTQPDPIVTTDRVSSLSGRSSDPRRSVSEAGQHGGAPRAAVTAKLPSWLVQRVLDLKSTACLFARYAAKSRVAAERRGHEHNAKACRRHAAASLIAYRRGALFPDTVHREACRIQQLTRAESRDAATAAMGGAS